MHLAEGHRPWLSAFMFIQHACYHTCWTCVESLGGLLHQVALCPRCAYLSLPLGLQCLTRSVHSLSTACQHKPQCHSAILFSRDKLSSTIVAVQAADWAVAAALSGPCTLEFLQCSERCAIDCCNEACICCEASLPRPTF